MLEVKSKIEKKLLTYYFLNINASHHLRELARILKTDPANLDKKLKQLEEIGLFKSDLRGNQKLYSLNHKFPLFQEYKSIINKTYGIDKVLTNALNNIPDIKQAYIFGSYANQNFDRFSDIDLLIVGNHNSLKLSKALNKIEKIINREVNVVEFDAEEYETKQKTDPLIININKNKTIQLI